ncbi:unnamed protein product, partial [Polarella glacialis]
AIGDVPRFAPGCVEDVEVTRTITPFGSLIRRLFSGRMEVCHSDGTTATRNPTAGELERQIEALRCQPPVGGSAAMQLELLGRFLKVSQEQPAERMRVEPSSREKAMGIPGHWVVVRPDGGMFGRALVSAWRPPTPQ